MPTFSAYVKAFWGALRLTLRGETLMPRVPPSPLALWTQAYDNHIQAVVQAAEQAGLDAAVRKDIKLRLDGRQIALETVLTTLRFHAKQEYPSLLSRGLDQQVLNTVYATNMNDQYWVMTVIKLPEFQQPLVQTALLALEAHLNTIPKVDPPVKP